MNTKPKAARFFLNPVQRPTPTGASGSEDMPFATNEDGFGSLSLTQAQSEPPEGARPEIDDSAIAAIAAEGLTGRQKRRARLLAQKHGLSFTSDLHAVYLLRETGLDPFKQSHTEPVPKNEPLYLTPVAKPTEVPSPGDTSRALTRLPGDQVNLPNTVRPINPPSPEKQAAVNQFAEIQRMQQDIVRRRRRRVALLFARLFVFVLLPTLFAGWYFYAVATPVYSTKTEFVIQSSEQSAGGGFRGLLAGTGFATSEDASAVQGYLQSREALLRLEQDLGFKAHFQNPDIDPLQRLAPDATFEDTYGVYQRFVKISHDPSEGLIRMEVMAIDPQTAAAWANQLIRYAEEQVDQLSSRMRTNQMADATAGYEDAQVKLAKAQRQMIELQEKFNVISSETELTLLTQQIAELESQLTREKLSLAQMEGNPNPSQARMEPIQRRIATLESEIAILRNRMTQGDASALSLADIRGELLLAQANVETRQLILNQTLQALEMARVEASRQVRYLSVSVNPTPPDEPAYPKAFENTLVTMLILMGIYLMVSMTAAILREQVSS